MKTSANYIKAALDAEIAGDYSEATTMFEKASEVAFFKSEQQIWAKSAEKAKIAAKERAIAADLAESPKMGPFGRVAIPRPQEGHKPVEKAAFLIEIKAIRAALIECANKLSEISTPGIPTGLFQGKVKTAWNLIVDATNELYFQ